MKLRLSLGGSIALRAIVAAGILGAFLLTLVLSVAPQLHERIHQPTGPNHECAVTLLSSGTCTHTPCDTIAIAPPLPRSASRFSDLVFQLVSPRLDFSQLEHAPPAIS
ncbi:MAG TPA: hypothetical protein VK581_13495 [Chthoniobacterales bacterium]|nr:hypothetical protein [Chthoniobacterales bacterium]